MNDSTDLAVRPQSGLAISEYMPVLSIEQAIARYNAVGEFTRRVLRIGMDYGVIPGTERKGSKDDGPTNRAHTLLKPGAEKLCTLFGLVPEFEDYRVTENWEQGLFYYAYRCKLMRGDRLVASGIGSANSREKKYRRAARVCPECGAAAIKRSKYPPKGQPNAVPGWYCEDRSGGCGRSFAADDPKLIEQKTVTDPNDAADQINTLQKMAQKRALVAATLIATNASEFFTQDAEDMIIDAEVISEPRREPAAEPPRRETRRSEPQQDQPDDAPDLNEDSVFLEQAQAELRARGFPQDEAEELVLATIEKQKKTLDQLPLAWRRGFIDMIKAGKCDKAKKAEPASKPAAGNQLPVEDLVALEWPDFVEAWWLELKDSVARTDFDGGIRAAVLKVGKRGHENDVSRQTRSNWVAASREGRFNWISGTVFLTEPAAAAR